MDNGVSIRPVQPSSTTPVRTEYAVQRQAVRTELPEVAAVASSAAPKDLRQEDSQRRLRADISTTLEYRGRAVTEKETERKVSYDNASREIVVSRVDPDTGNVINQFPDDAILRQRAYLKATIDDVATLQTNRESNADKLI